MDEKQKLQAIYMLGKLPQPFKCTDIANVFNAKFSPRVDWHEFATLLDGLHTAGVLEVVEIDNAGRTCYKFRSN